MTTTVVVVGSANVDQVMQVERIPAPGETVLSHGMATVRGGKGQNQAVAAARAGAATTFVAAVGDDGFGSLTVSGLVADGVNVERVRTVDAPTGTALIAVDVHGENTIIVEAGANTLLALDDADRSAIESAAVLVMQLEVPVETVEEAARVARSAETTVLLNAAPIRDLSDSLLATLDILVVNEHELAHLSEARGTDVTALVPTVVVTLGSAGAVLRRRGLPEVSVPAPRVNAVDATGAGDTFCGAFAAALAEGQDAEKALVFAVTAASLSVQAAGAVPSIPGREAIEQHLPAS